MLIPLGIGLTVRSIAVAASVGHHAGDACVVESERINAGSGERLDPFMRDSGLIRVEEGSRDWKVIGRDWGECYLIHLAVDPADPERLEVADAGNGGRDGLAS